MLSQLIFLPGALGRTAQWRPISTQLAHSGERIHFGWPGFGSTPSDPLVSGIDDLVRLVVARINKPTALLAQSMGGVVAIRAALEKPTLITHLVLAVTSGGVDVRGLGGADWRPAFRQANPHLPEWFSSDQHELSDRLAELTMPVLLLWGDSDPISPVSVGKRLAGLFPQAELHVVSAGDHDLLETHAAILAPIINAHLSGKD